MKNSSRTLNGVDSLVTCAASLLFPLGAPVKVWTTRLQVWGGSVHRQGCGCWPATLPTSSSSSELLAEKFGVGGSDMEDRREGGRGSSSSVSSETYYFSLSLSESITISHIWFWDSRRAHFTWEIALSIAETIVPLLGGTKNSQLTYVTTSARELGKMLFPLPTNTYQAATQLPVTKIA